MMSSRQAVLANTAAVMQKLEEAGLTFDEGALEGRFYVSISPRGEGFEMTLMGGDGDVGIVEIGKLYIEADDVEVISPRIKNEVKQTFALPPPKRKQTAA